ncbi:hypothetical protein D0463_01360 [Bacillus sp. V59.32b]|nr:hypothetical protein D0463_01360 [Bacillus sp. V59.32b]
MDGETQDLIPDVLIVSIILFAFGILLKADEDIGKYSKWMKSQPGTKAFRNRSQRADGNSLGTR